MDIEPSNPSAQPAASKPPSEMALDELTGRIAGDQSLSKDVKDALLADLIDENPAGLTNFIAILNKQGTKGEANAA